MIGSITYMRVPCCRYNSYYIGVSCPDAVKGCQRSWASHSISLHITISTESAKDDGDVPELWLWNYMKIHWTLMPMNCLLWTSNDQAFSEDQAWAVSRRTSSIRQVCLHKGCTIAPLIPVHTSHLTHHSASRIVERHSDVFWLWRIQWGRISSFDQVRSQRGFETTRCSRLRRTIHHLQSKVQGYLVQRRT